MSECTELPGQGEGEGQAANPNPTGSTSPRSTPYTSLYLPTSPYISLHLLISPVYLPGSSVHSDTDLADLHHEVTLAISRLHLR